MYPCTPVVSLSSYDHDIFVAQSVVRLADAMFTSITSTSVVSRQRREVRLSSLHLGLY